MGQQRLNQNKPAAPTREPPTKTSVKSPVNPVEEMQAAIGNREMGRLMESNRLPHPSSPFPKLQGELPLLGEMPVSQGTIQRQPLFRGLSQELTADTAMALPATGAVIQPELVQQSRIWLRPKGDGKKLPEAVRQKMEIAFGTDFSDVRVHEGPEAESIGAIAYTRGSHIHFAPGKYNLTSLTGQQLLGHELTHVVQQRAGRVRGFQGNEDAINADPALEAEADAMSTNAVRGESAIVQGAGVRRSSFISPLQCSFRKIPKLVPLLYLGFIGRNLYRQEQVLRGEWEPSSREAAMLSTSHFGPNTVGYGVYPSIRLIHALLGNIGQSNIGSLFKSKQVQQLLAQPIDSAANLKVGEIEYALWRNRMMGIGASGQATVGELFGGSLGSSVPPEQRANIQYYMALFRNYVDKKE